jgi:hypothetical protein
MGMKQWLFVVASSLGMTTAALYERQRALVRAGLLHARPGRGPGSGVDFDAPSVAMLLIAVLATESLSEVEELAKATARLRSVEKRCPLTGKPTFGSALAAVLASVPLAERVQWVEVRRSGVTNVTGRIYFSPTPEERAAFNKKYNVSEEEAAAMERAQARVSSVPYPLVSYFGSEGRISPQTSLFRRQSVLQYPIFIAEKLAIFSARVKEVKE